MATSSTKRSPPVPPLWRDASSLRLVALVVVAAIALGSSLLSYLWLSGRAAVESSHRSAEQLTLALEEHLTAVTQAVDAVLLQTTRRLNQLGPARTVQDENEILREAHLSLPLLTAIAHVDAGGRLVAHSGWTGQEDSVDLADREFYGVHRDSPDLGLYVTAPPQTARAADQRLLFFSRRLSTAEGEFDGLINAAVAVDFFTGFFSSLKIGAEGIVTLARKDGIVLIREPAAGLIGTSIAVGPLFTEYVPRSPFGTYRSVTRSDGIERVAAYRTLPNFPFVVAVGIAIQDTLSAQRTEAMVFGGVWAAFVAVLLVAAAFMIAQTRQRAVAEWTLEQTRRSEERANAYLRDAIESLQDAFYLFDAKDRLVVANTPALEKVALAAERANLWPPAPLDDDSAPVAFTPHGAPVEVASGGRWELIRERPTADGGKVILHTDITTLKVREEQLARARVEADAANRAKSDFLATMSHEIRTPLNGLLGFSELLLGTELNLQQTRYATAVSDSGRMLLSLLNDILDYSRIEAGRVELERANFSLRAIVAGVVSSLQLAARAKALNLSMSIDPDVPEYIVGDPLRLKQILLNLIGNAIKFTERGAVDVHVSRTGNDPERLHLRFDIRDTGIGIAEDAQGKLFERFSQADSSISRRYGGSGLGLAISKRLTELMGGEIGLESQAGKGSTFWFTAVVDEGARPIEGPIPPPGTVRTAPSRRILIVDDVEMNRYVAESLLKRNGHAVTSVASGPEAIEAVRKENFDLILMDVQMPDMDGCAAALAIQQLPGAAGSTPIVALTANAMPAEVERCLQSGMRGHIAKPVDGAALDAAIHRWALRNAA